MPSLVAFTLPRITVNRRRLHCQGADPDSSAPRDPCRNATEIHGASVAASGNFQQTCGILTAEGGSDLTRPEGIMFNEDPAKASASCFRGFWLILTP